MISYPKYALIIAIEEFEDPNISQLTCPIVDAEKLGEVLEDPAIGQFQVQTILNSNFAETQVALAEFLGSKSRNELRLVYFSGHGLLDEKGRLYLAARDTKLSQELLTATSVSATFITERLDFNRAKRQMLILDCCYAGAFENQGIKGSQLLGSNINSQSILPGSQTERGRIVFTATDSIQYAWEGKKFVGDSGNSLFTHYLIKGLKTGEADINIDGKIEANELFVYIYNHVTNDTNSQTPRKWSYRQELDIVVAENPQANQKKITRNKKALPPEQSFRGRQQELSEIEAKLEEKKVLLIVGLAGIGKTSLALRYVYQNVDISFVLWYAMEVGDSPEAFIIVVATRLMEMGHNELYDAVTNPKLNLHNKIDVLLQMLQSLNILLVIDAIEVCLMEDRDLAPQFRYLINKLLEANFTAKVIFTSKVRPKINPQFLGNYVLYELRGLDVDTASALFVEFSESSQYTISKEDSEIVCKMVEGHPFALKIISSLIQQGFPLDDLLQKMRQVVTKDYGIFLLDILVDSLDSQACSLLETISVYRRPVIFGAIQKLPSDHSRIKDLLPLFLVEVEKYAKYYHMHSIVRDYAYSRLKHKPEKFKRSHKAAGDYYNSILHTQYKRKPDYQTIQRILEAQFHYIEAEYIPGVVAASKYFVSDEVKNLVLKLQNQGDTEKIDQLYQTILEVDAQDARIHEHYADYLRRNNGEVDDITYHYKSAVECWPKNSHFQMKYILWLVKNEDFVTAKDAFENAHRFCPRPINCYIPYAKALTKAKNFDDAISVLRTGINKIDQKTIVPLIVQLSKTLRKAGRIEEAIPSLERTVKRFPPKDNKILYIEYSKVLRELGREQEAIMLLDRAFQNTNFIPIAIELVKMLHQNNDFEKAETVAKQGLEANQNSRSVPLFIVYFRLLSSHSLHQSIEKLIYKSLLVTEAQSLMPLYCEFQPYLQEHKKHHIWGQFLSKMQSQFPQSSLQPFYFDYCYSLYTEGNYENALAILENIDYRDFSPKSKIRYIIQKAQILVAKNEIQEAIDVLTNDLASFSEELIHEIYLLKALIYQELEDIEQAKAVLNEAFTAVHQTNYTLILAKYAELLRTQSRHDEALAMLCKALPTENNEHNLLMLYIEYCHLTREKYGCEDTINVIDEGLERLKSSTGKGVLLSIKASCQYYKNKKAEAFETLDIAKELSKGRLSTPYATQACIYWDMGELENAQNYFELGMKFTPKPGAMIYKFYSAFLYQTGKKELAQEVLENGQVIVFGCKFDQRILEFLETTTPQELLHRGRLSGIDAQLGSTKRFSTDTLEDIDLV
jgi:uncharacterized caspase-like protein/Tfp pilus assembly protein PilF